MTNAREIPNRFVIQLRQLHVISMARRISFRFLVEVSLQRVAEIDSRLIRQANGDEQDVGKLVSEIAKLLTRLTGLLATSTRENPCDFSHLLDELGKVGQLIEVANADGLNPIIDFPLCASDR